MRFDHNEAANVLYIIEQKHLQITTEQGKKQIINTVIPSKKIKRLFNYDL